MPSRRKTRRGGRRIGEGTRNAVFSIPFPCDPPLGDRPVVMLVSLDALNGIREDKSDEELRALEAARPSRPLSGVITKLREIDSRAERFYYPLACAVRAPRDEEPIEEVLSDLTPEQRERLVPFVQIVPFAPNGSLAERAPTTPIVDTIRSDVAFLHENGIAHGDLSKANVVFDGADRPHLIDFGQSYLRKGDTGVVVPAGFEADIPDWAAAVNSDTSDLRRMGQPPRRRRGGTRRRLRKSTASGRA